MDRTLRSDSNWDPYLDHIFHCIPSMAWGPTSASDQKSFGFSNRIERHVQYVNNGSLGFGTFCCVLFGIQVMFYGIASTSKINHSCG